MLLLMLKCVFKHEHPMYKPPSEHITAPLHKRPLSRAAWPTLGLSRPNGGSGGVWRYDAAVGAPSHHQAVAPPI
jgi:hypothetical protein